MRFIRYITPENEKMLNRIYKQSKHHKVRQRAQCILLSFRERKTIKELTEIFNTERKTICSWFNAYENEQLIGLYERTGRGRKPKLTEEQQSEVINLVRSEPKSLKKVQIEIQNNWEIKVSKDTIKRIIKKTGMRWKRMKRGLTKSPEEWELEVKLPEIKKLEELAKKGGIDLGYLDEAGWGMRACIPYGWQDKEPIILKDIEGKRLNALGIMLKYNKIFYEIHEVTINSEIVIKFLDSFSETLKIKTVLFMDQSSIHTSDKFLQKVEEWKKKNLEIFWLPAYSPHLNLIEILWRFMKYEWIEVKAYENRNSLRNYIEKVLNGFGKEYVINFA